MGKNKKQNKKQPAASTPTPGVSGKSIPTLPATKNRAASWSKFKSNVIDTKMKSLHVIMPSIPGKQPVEEKTDNDPQANESNTPEPQKNVWQRLNPIPTIAVSNSQTQQQKSVTKFDMTEKPKPTVVEQPASSIQLNLDKSKGLMVGKSQGSPNPVQQNEAATAAQSSPPIKAAKPLMPNPGGLLPTPLLDFTHQNQGFLGRMTASSFMKPKTLLNNKPGILGPVPMTMPYIQPKGMAGIPRSFLIEQQRQQQEQLFQQQHQLAINQIYSNMETGQSPAPGQGPIWEAKINPQESSWNPVQNEVYHQNQAGVAFDQGGQAFGHTGQVSGQVGSNVTPQLHVQTDNSMDQPKSQYSPSDVYADASMNEELQDDSSESQSGLKRLSAFQRLGPVTNPKKPKLTINLLFNKEQAVREVVDQSEAEEVDKYVPAHLKPDIQTSLDDTVMKYLVFWPWKKPVVPRRTITARQSKSVMLIELEQMEEAYSRDSAFFKVLVRGYPESWNKEDVLDAVLESVKGKSFIPCFIEFTKSECKFLVIRSKPALVAIHRNGFVTHKKDVQLTLSIMQITLSVNQIDFIPRLVLRKRLSMAMEGETELSLTEFTTKDDVSHFIYFPLNRVANQTELMQLQSSVPWEFLTKLDLSHNRITTLSGFDLPHYTPRLKHLDLSYNHIESITTLLQCRELPLTSIVLEGNPLCADYIEKERYIKVLRMMFSGLKEIDGVPFTLTGDFPKSHRNYCPPDSSHIVEKVLEVMFPLLDAPPEERQLIEDLYDVNAVCTVTFMYKLRYGPIFKDCRALFSRARVMDEGDMECIEGAGTIAKVINRWPILQHDPLTFTVDVMYHSDTTTILRISGIVRLTAETLAEDEHLLSFTRTLVLHSIDSMEYKITNEMIYWDLPDKDKAREAFQMTTIRSKNLSLKLETPPDEDLKEKLLDIFMKVTELDRKPSLKCLEVKEWHLKNALEYFSKLLKLDNLELLID